MNLPARAGKIESRIVMKTEFKGELCVYCGTTPADTADHIVCKQFFLENRRANLPQAPACSACNNEKSKLELYLTTVLAFGGRRPDAAANLATRVPKRLKNNAKLLRELKAGFDKSGGKTVPLDSARLNLLFAMIARDWRGITGRYDWGLGTPPTRQHSTMPANPSLTTFFRK